MPGEARGVCCLPASLAGVESAQRGRLGELGFLRLDLQFMCSKAAPLEEDDFSVITTSVMDCVHCRKEVLQVVALLP